MSGEKFMHSIPSNRVNTTGYAAGSRVNRIVVARSARCRFTPLFNSIAPVMNVPPGTTTRPPPAAWQAAIAARNALVLSAWSSPTAPKAVTSKSRAGNVGGLIRARIAGRSRQETRGAAGAARGAHAGARLSDAAGGATASAPAATIFSTCRRLGMGSVLCYDRAPLSIDKDDERASRLLRSQWREPSSRIGAPGDEIVRTQAANV